MIPILFHHGSIAGSILAHTRNRTGPLITRISCPIIRSHCFGDMALLELASVLLPQ